MEPDLDKNYISAKSDFYVWKSVKSSAVPVPAME